MKKGLFILILLISLGALTINGISFINAKDGVYLNVNHRVYEVFAPIEKITSGYIQIDCE